MKKFKKLQVLTVINKYELLLSYLNILYIYNCTADKLILKYRFKTDFFTLLSKTSVVLRRLLRKDIRYALAIGDELVMVRDRKIFFFSTNLKKILWEIQLPRGSRPLNMSHVKNLQGFQDGIYFGEYFSNPNLEHVSIYSIIDGKLEEAYRFSNGLINHIHNLVVDKNNNCIWILTGDTGKGTGIYCAKEHFTKVDCIVTESQEYRACVSFPYNKGLLYATDSQYMQNSIRLLVNKDNKWISEKIADINGPCIYGTKIKDKYVFTTSVECDSSGSKIALLFRRKKGPGIILKRSEVIVGNIESGFETVYYSKKDYLPYVLFQFGNILLPTGDYQLDDLYITNIALKNDDFSTQILKI